MHRRNDDSTCGELPFDQLSDQLLARSVEVSCGLIEHPEWHCGKGDTCQGHTAALTGRERAYRAVGESARVDLGKCLRNLLRTHLATNADRVAEVFRGREVCLEW